MSVSLDSASSTAAVLVTLLVVVSAVTVAVGFGAVSATHQNAETTDGFKPYTGDGSIPQPDTTYDVKLFNVPAYSDHDGPIPPKVEFRVDRVEYYSATISTCDVPDVETGGVDRGNDDPGTSTDEDLVPNLYDNGDYETTPEDDPGPVTDTDWEHRQVTWLEFAPEDAFSTDPFYLHTDGVADETILAVRDCITMPDVEGWYRTWVFFNGTIKEIHGDDQATVQGETYEEGDYIEGWEPSLWYPVCDCNQSRHVPMRIGVPPGEMTPGQDGGIIHPNGTIEAPSGTVQEDGTIVFEDESLPPENVTAEGLQLADGFLELTGPIIFGEGRIDADGTIVTPGGTEYPPADQDESPATPTPTPVGTDDGGPTETDAGPVETDSNDDPGNAASTKESTGTSTDAGQTGPSTPTQGSGAGFGTFAALLALLASFLALRRCR